MEEEEEKEEEKEVPSRGGESGVSHKRTLVCYCLSRGGYVVCVFVSCFLFFAFSFAYGVGRGFGRWSFFHVFFAREKCCSWNARAHPGC